MTDSVVVEGYARLRDGKKVFSLTKCADGYFRSSTLICALKKSVLCFVSQWKTRWLVLRKPSPVAGNVTSKLTRCALGSETFALRVNKQTRTERVLRCLGSVVAWIGPGLCSDIQNRGLLYGVRQRYIKSRTT